MSIKTLGVVSKFQDVSGFVDSEHVVSCVNFFYVSRGVFLCPFCCLVLCMDLMKRFTVVCVEVCALFFGCFRIYMSYVCSGWRGLGGMYVLAEVGVCFRFL